MRTRLYSLLAALALATVAQLSQGYQFGERRLSSMKDSGRQLMHMEMTQTPLYGNQTGLYYYYATVYFGSHRQPQTLIVDTGSSATAIPCAEVCDDTSCGTHLSPWYEATESETLEVLDCNYERCYCVDNDYCEFYQGYMDGSVYEGYLIRDQLYFGEEIHHKEAFGFDFYFACVHTENELFYYQDADGILGLSGAPYQYYTDIEPIHVAMYREGMIDKLQFTLCLGQDGGYFQVGGFDGTAFLEEEPTWVPVIKPNHDFEVKLQEMRMSDRKITSANYNVFIDSGTTYTYFPQTLWDTLVEYFQEFCEDKSGNCRGKGRSLSHDSDQSICFTKGRRQSDKEFLTSFPVLRFGFETTDGEPYTYDWMPSEYLYRSGRNYCFAALINEEDYIMFGGTAMRQHAIVFDVENSRVGFARSSCSDHPHQIVSEDELNTTTWVGEDDTETQDDDLAEELIDLLNEIKEEAE